MNFWAWKFQYEVHDWDLRFLDQITNYQWPVEDFHNFLRGVIQYFLIILSLNLNIFTPK